MKTSKIIILFICAAMVCALCGCVSEVRDFSDRTENTGETPEKTESNEKTEKGDIAATVGDHEINSVEMVYFYKDAINNAYSQMYQQAYQQYPQNPEIIIPYMYGLDPAISLSEQFYDEAGTTWADHFIQQAMENARNAYAIYDKAISENYTLSAQMQAELEETVAQIDRTAALYGYSDVDDYLKATYDKGASKKSYSKYLETLMIAYAYSSDYAASLESKFDETAIRNYDSKHPNEYDSFTYTQVYLPISLFLGEGTLDENGDVIYTDAEKDAAYAKAKAVADALARTTSEEEFNKRVSDLDVNAQTQQVATKKYENTLYSNVTSMFRDWVSSAARTKNETTVLEGTSGIGEEKVINGYYVIMFHSRNDNKQFPANVRHLLVLFEGDTDDLKAKAKAEADGYLQIWQEGERTKESFIELVKAHSDDSSASTGGLFENITPDSPYVKNFLNWSIDPNRRAGDAEVIETEFGYHVMYFDSFGDTTYRDSMIKSVMQNEAYDTWYKSIVDPVTIEQGDISKLPRDFIIASAS